MKRNRFNFIQDEKSRLLIVRPIGDLPGDVFARNVIEAYSRVEAPWTYNRIIDLRRHDGYVSDGDRGRIAAAWAEITAGITYRAYVAMLMHDALEARRLPQIHADFPHETICIFSDYHEAVGWVLAADQADYLAGLSECPVVAPNYNVLSIE